MYLGIPKGAPIAHFTSSSMSSFDEEPPQPRRIASESRDERCRT
jgi:hypothetical protein